jgi:hypothetical protein
LFPHTALTVWFVRPRGSMFTARYGLNPKDRNNFNGGNRLRVEFLSAYCREMHQESGGNITQTSTLWKYVWTRLGAERNNLLSRRPWRTSASPREQPNIYQLFYYSWRCIRDFSHGMLNLSAQFQYSAHRANENGALSCYRWRPRAIWRNVDAIHAQSLILTACKVGTLRGGWYSVLTVDIYTHPGNPRQRIVPRTLHALILDAIWI